ncbi:hypothetical protein G7074_05445 [Pedobacter sp. HDW13]|uniref:hypothetical protein n=1 Tax=unclassified Pedobacter TaxID=2628915 RepID=UPI000F5B5EA1|nr:MULTISPECIES: hypothetical protein [unclassified Pedobacter]QIL38773.1 hypothetical protein G7074_05445 [Pedobacter sp. HDW13]RQO80060.1 hypothetical protein DBR40_00105 [Pedobacter sp. KBW01]
MEIKRIIESGLMETYVMGIATEEEVQKVLLLKKEYPEFKDALAILELDMEVLAQGMAIQPPAGMLEKIEVEINEIQRRSQTVQKVTRPNANPDNNENSKEEKYIEVEAESNQMRVNKAWKWVFIAVFILGKIFLASAIYFYLENRQAREQINELKLELKQK